MVMTRSPAGSIHEVEIAFNDPMTTGAVDAGAGIELPGGQQAALRGEHKGKGTVPDENRVTRSLKKGRIIAVLPVTPIVTRDQVLLLGEDNVVTPGAPGLAELGITPTALEPILPTYLYRDRKGGQFAEYAAA